MRFYFYKLPLTSQNLSHFIQTFIVKTISSWRLISGTQTWQFVGVTKGNLSVLPVRIVNLNSKLLLPKVQVFQLLPLVELEGIEIVIYERAYLFHAETLSLVHMFVFEWHQQNLENKKLPV